GLSRSCDARACLRRRLARVRVDHAWRARPALRSANGPCVRQGEQGTPRTRRPVSRRRARHLPARTTSKAGARSWQGRPVFERARFASHAHGRMEDSAPIRRARGHHEARVAAHAAAFVCDASARGRRRSARGPGNARPRRHFDNADLHARGSGVPPSGAQAVSSESVAPTRMLLVIDNYDSFTYNLVQYLGELGAEIVVQRNDAVTVEEIGELAPSAIVISPGPCAPAQAGVTVDVIRRWGSSIPTLGVCLGHQAIGEAYGGV